MTCLGRYVRDTVDMHLMDLARTIQSEKEREISAIGRRRQLLVTGDQPPGPQRPDKPAGTSPQPAATPLPTPR